MVLTGKKGQAVMVGVMVMIMLFIAIVQFIDPLKEIITSARAVDQLDCANLSISTGNRAACILIDFSLFYFLGMAFAAAVAYLTKRKIEDSLQ